MSLLLTLPFMAAFIVIPDTIMSAYLAHGAFRHDAAAAAATALAAYGIGLPAMAMIRIVPSTFYARHDTMTPVRATLTAFTINIAAKFFFVWGLHMGVAGIALGTAIGAWTNVAILVWLGRSRDLLAIEKIFVHALPAALRRHWPAARAPGWARICSRRMAMSWLWPLQSCWRGWAMAPCCLCSATSCRSGAQRNSCGCSWRFPFRTWLRAA